MIMSSYVTILSLQYVCKSGGQGAGKSTLNRLEL